jgi:hypothetical protein
VIGSSQNFLFIIHSMTLVVVRNVTMNDECLIGKDIGGSFCRHLTGGTEESNDEPPSGQ